jgi:hypothetical protein
VFGGFGGENKKIPALGEDLRLRQPRLGGFSKKV